MGRFSVAHRAGVDFGKMMFIYYPIGDYLPPDVPFIILRQLSSFTNDNGKDKTLRSNFDSFKHGDNAIL